MHARSIATFVKLPIDFDLCQKWIFGIEWRPLIFIRIESDNFTSEHAISSWVWFQFKVTNGSLIFQTRYIEFLADCCPEIFLPWIKIFFDTKQSFDSRAWMILDYLYDSLGHFARIRKFLKVTLKHFEKIFKVWRSLKAAVCFEWVNKLWCPTVNINVRLYSIS